MKKITALLVSLIMSCAVMAGCSDSSSSSSSKSRQHIKGRNKRSR